MNNLVLIMASGGENGVWKHAKFPNNLLLPIAGEPLVARAAQQVREATGADAIVLTHWPEVQEVVPLYFVPEKHYAYTETFLSAHRIWSFAARVTVLNGDMVWHDDVLRFILLNRESPALYGDTIGNVFAWAFNKEHTERVMCAADHGAHTKGSPSQVHFFRRLWGVSTLRKSNSFICVQPARTYTRDFDIAKDYDYEKWQSL